MEQIVQFLQSKGMSEDQIQNALDMVKQHVPNAESLIDQHGAEGILNMLPQGATNMIEGLADKLPGPLGDMVQGFLGQHDEPQADGEGQ